LQIKAKSWEIIISLFRVNKYIGHIQIAGCRYGGGILPNWARGVGEGHIKTVTLLKQNPSFQWTSWISFWLILIVQQNLLIISRGMHDQFLCCKGKNFCSYFLGVTANNIEIQIYHIIGILRFYGNFHPAMIHTGMISWLSKFLTPQGFGVLPSQCVLFVMNCCHSISTLLLFWSPFVSHGLPAKRSRD